ncbi:Asp-tRNA(Asn)/Glu-tRNA(Gln) amidotransferase subunit GatC [Gammaproteobacteria bacterium]|nr:Asp-tRNA(Asn)/Glu-tRNA(Gln) amidotransferase subunit GatC [Gammaproteobacteria bacterium]
MDKKTVANIAYLSRLKLNADNEEKITLDLENIIKFVDQLNDVNVENIAPLTSPLEKTAKTRSDEVTAKNRKDVFLERAPKSNEDYFLVPRVVE